MLRKIKTNEFVQTQLWLIRDDLMTMGVAYDCPGWDCEDCERIFPRVVGGGCPCGEYEKEYLIKRLTEIINYNAKINKEKK